MSQLISPLESTLESQTSHIQIFNKKRYKRDYIQEIIQGKKTFEMRFLSRRTAPYGKLKNGDLVYLKESGKGILATYIVENVEHIELLGYFQVRDLFEKYRDKLSIATNLEFEQLIRERESCKYVTYFDIANAEVLPSPIILNHRFNMSSWLIL